MAEQRRQAGREGRGSERRTHKHTDRDAQAEFHRNMYGNVCIYKKYKHANKTTSQHTHTTFMYFRSKYTT